VAQHDAGAPLGRLKVGGQEEIAGELDALAVKVTGFDMASSRLACSEILFVEHR
jgi:hypothetical protein